ncbi:hypothetical protein [Corynebacterium neomassiliense]|uniref:hypothetical protein n=1 Tax=Corynebacterium neomassiliense TaxID=2079482 RepID=UPI001030130F|nr:hypothetical protein [Corynebacterium neomassiliense]
MARFRTPGLLLAAAVTAALLSCGSEPGTPETTGDRKLNALYDSDGVLDCRRLYSDVPVSLLLDAGLSTTTEPMASSKRFPSGRTFCPMRYVGPGWPGTVPVPVYVATDHKSFDLTWNGKRENYDGWKIGHITLKDGDENLAAELTAEDNSSVIVFTPLAYVPDAPEEIIENPLGDGIVDALKVVVDGLDRQGEETVHGRTEYFSEAGEFNCSLIYDRLSAVGLQDAGLDVSDVRFAPSRTIERSNGSMSCDLIPSANSQGKANIQYDSYFYPVEINTGPRDDHRGTPFDSRENLPGWEEYWDFNGADRPVNRSNEGKESYNARFCRSDRNCITVTNFMGYGESGSGRPVSPVVDDIRSEILPLVRWIDSTENSGTAGDS